MDDSKEKMSSRYNRTNIWTYEPKHRTYEPKSLQHHTHDLHMFKPDGVLALRGRSGYGIQSLRSFLQLIPTGKRKIIFSPMVSHCLYYQPFISQALCPGVGGQNVLIFFFCPIGLLIVSISVVWGFLIFFFLFKEREKQSWTGREDLEEMQEVKT